MHGISKSRHEHLKAALLQMEGLLSERQKECGCLQQAIDYNRELEIMYRTYERLLSELAGQITAYEIFHNQVKVQFLAKKLKELKKEISVQKPAFPMLIENIQLAYET
ncbi:hypothetical protein [Pedobacter alluvionis]|uniref:Uncharacterized protein n=1 Tax=Pedobacter alluvionis TaxID=475253 RepID=A0A497XN27_9SPHI|nr:hypothetical protein [Pedobacter alluvionis]RLJ69579.1 hypothetical protein BCL90_5177 [Pedobacter alluvionis]TFB28360.1 hypothetical protein E3V97_23035 [Pedobacter alluvionis]